MAEVWRMRQARLHVYHSCYRMSGGPLLRLRYLGGDDWWMKSLHLDFGAFDFHWWHLWFFEWRKT